MNQRRPSFLFTPPAWAGAVVILAAVLAAALFFGIGGAVLILLAGLLFTGILWVVVRRAGQRELQLRQELQKKEEELLQLNQRLHSSVGQDAPGKIPDSGAAPWSAQKSRLLFQFAETVEFSAQVLKLSEEFSRSRVHGVLTGFQDLQTTAASISDQVRDSFQQITDPQSSESLCTIVRESEAIDASLNLFFDQLKKLLELTNTRLKADLNELDRVRAMAAVIDEFFENIRMISLNLSIEASRVGGGKTGKAFQVLAHHLREFSTKAREISAEQQTVVENAGRAIGESAVLLKTRFDELAALIAPLKDRLDPFPQIVAETRTRLDHVLQELSRLSQDAKATLTREIGQLQFQDISRQEVEHVSALLRQVAGEEETAPLGPADQKTLREELVKIFTSLVTTGTERQAVKAYLERWGLASDLLSDEGEARQSGAVELF